MRWSPPSGLPELPAVFLLCLHLHNPVPVIFHCLKDSSQLWGSSSQTFLPCIKPEMRGRMGDSSLVARVHLTQDPWPRPRPDLALWGRTTLSCSPRPHTGLGPHTYPPPSGADGPPGSSDSPETVHPDYLAHSFMVPGWGGHLGPSESSCLLSDA